MKITKIAPLFAAALLLAGCSGNGVTTLKKPSFAKYSNEVKLEDFSKAAQEKTEGLMDLFETEGTGDAKTIKGLKTGLTMTRKSYQNDVVKGKSAGGLSMSYNSKIYQESEQKIDRANKRVLEVTKAEQSGEAKNGSGYAYFHAVGDKEDVLINSEAQYGSGKSTAKVKFSEQEQMEFGEKQVKEIHVDAKSYEAADLPSNFDYSKYMAQMAYYQMGGIVENLYYNVPDYLSSDDVKFYVDGDVLTIAAEKDMSGTAKYNEVEYTSKAKVSYVAQINYAKLTFATSLEVSVDETTKNGNTKVESKEYAQGTFVNKDVTVKAVDTSKFTNLDA